MKRYIFILISVLSAFIMQAEPVEKPLAFYLKNLPQTRIGEMSDDAIIADLKARDFIVIEVDCSSFPKTSPELEVALTEWYRTSSSVYSEYESDDAIVDIKRVFCIPEGYTVTTDIPIWSIETHGADGSLQKVVNTWNEYIVKDKGQEPVTDYTQMKNPDGSPIDWYLRMDIVHPSGSTATKVPLVMNFASSSARMKTLRPDTTTDRNIFPLGFLTSGYAFACADHCYNPLAKDETWGYYSWYSLEDWNGLASATAYIRYLRLHANQYNLNGKIGVWGISKASYSAMRVADPDNASGAEHFLFNNKANDKPQPWQGADSNVDVSYAAAGNGTARVGKYVNPNCVPMITSAGLTDQYGCWDKYPAVVRHMLDIDHIHLPFWMEDMGHNFPSKGIDYTTGELRYHLFKRFFDHYLKPDPATSADVFYIIPKDKAENVDQMGVSRALPADNLLPSYMLDIPTSSPITVRFLEEYDASEISARVSITESESGAAVSGVWSGSMHNTTFSFTPDEPLQQGKSYKITVPAGMTSKAGNHSSSPAIRNFTVSKSSIPSDGVKTKKIYPTDDTYSTFYSPNTPSPKGSNVTLQVRYSQYGEWHYASYFKYDLSQIDTVRMNKALLHMTLSGVTSSSTKLVFKKTVGTDWSEATLVSTNRPSFESTSFAQFTVEPTTESIEIDVTKVVRDCIEAGETKFSFVVDATSASTAYVYLHSKEAENETFRPYMSVERFAHKGSPTIRLPHTVKAQSPVRLAVDAEYEDEIKSVKWYIDDTLCETEVFSFSSGKHKVKAVVKGPDRVGTDIILKYVKAE